MGYNCKVKPYLPDAEVFPGKRPTVVQVHGGPTAQSRPAFRPVEQYLVNRGIVCR